MGSDMFILFKYAQVDSILPAHSNWFFVLQANINLYLYGKPSFVYEFGCIYKDATSLSWLKTDGSRVKLVQRIKIKCGSLVCNLPPLQCIVTPSFSVEWEDEYLKKGHGGAVSDGTVLYFGLLGQVVGRVDGRVHSLHGEEGSQVGSI